jgi:uncharacterized DUF497 family protein
VHFEFDRTKSAANKAKHGIDFVEAQVLWDSAVVEGEARAKDGEVRGFAIGKIGDKVWIAIFTRRGDAGNVIRLISVRRATPKEQVFYGK